MSEKSKIFLNYLRFILGIGLISIFYLAVNAAVTVDTTFNAYLSKVGDGEIFRSAIQPDGKIITGGRYQMVNGKQTSAIVRLNPDGTLDPTFNSTRNSQNLLVELQSTGKIIVANGEVIGSIARLNADGSLDQVFNNNVSALGISTVYDFKVLPDDKIVVAGTRPGSHAITRLNADGTLDATFFFGSLIFRLDIQPDGKVVYFTPNFIRRLNQDLSADNTFTQVVTNNTLYFMKVQPDGKILISGTFNNLNGTPSPRIARINSDGSVDVAFVTNMLGAEFAYTLLYLQNGKIIVPTSGGVLTLRNSDGTLDSSFTTQTNINGRINDFDLQPDGKILVSGLTNYDNNYRPPIVRINTDGSADTTFNAAIGGIGTGTQILMLPDNKFFVNGNFNYASGVAQKPYIKFNADGTVDTSYNQGIYKTVLDYYADGKLIARNPDNGNTFAILNPDGTINTVFPQTVNNVNAVKTLPDGKVLMAMSGVLRRYDAEGNVDSAFLVPTNGSISNIALQTNGKIVIGGSFTQVHGVDRSKIARLNSDGTLDTSFNSPIGGINGTVQYVRIQSEEKIIIGGTFTGISFNIRNGLARLNAEGSLDTGFVPPNSIPIDDVKLQSDGKVLLVGPNRCQRLLSNGSLDSTFNCVITPIQNQTPYVRNIGLQSDGKIILVGDFAKINGVDAAGIVRVVESNRVSFDYDGDGRADVSVFRASENRWYLFRSSDNTVIEQFFGTSGDVVSPADYDGDGKTDIGIFRPSTGDWWYQSSINNQQIQNHWGANGDIPRPSDFDGDGKADFIIFRPAENNWYRFGTTAGVSVVNFGLAGDKPVIGDFDGDGKSDVAIFRPSTGDWWYRSSINNAQLATRWGISTDIPAPADYDGDGKRDFAVYRPSTGVWYVINSSNGSFTIMAFGISEDKPVPADYDGDGKADIAVFRPSTGIWYQMRSTAGFAAQQFGIATDIPTPNSFVP